MYEGNSFLSGPDYSGLAEVPPPPPEKPPKTPEFFDDDDDDEVEEEPKTIRDYFEKQDKETAEKSEEEEEPAEPESEENSDAEEEISDEEVEDSEEADTATPELTDQEVQEAAVEIIDDRKQAANAEVDQAPDVVTETEALAAEAFLDAAKNEIDQGQPVDEALEAAKAKTLEELGLEQEPETPEETQAEEPPQTPETTEIPEVIESTEPTEPEEPDNTVPPVPPTPPTPPTPPGGGMPPVPPGGGAPGGPGGPAGPGFTGGNVLPPLPATPNATPTAPETTTDRRGKGRYLLVGGLVGYMIGRRGGRLRTEAKLLPVQRKLEKEVGQLHDKIFWYEASVRNLAHEKAVQNPTEAKQTAERLKQRKRETNPEKPIEQKTDTAHSERLGKFVVETQPDRLRRTQELKPIDLMTVPELLSVAEGIEIEQSNIRRLYETNRLNYEGLKRIVRAYLQGERYDQLVRDNLLTPEKYSYPETLTPNGQPQAQAWPQGASQPNSVVQQNPLGSSVDPSQPFQTNPYLAPPESNAARSQVTMIAVGVVIAVLILIFFLAQ